MCGIISYTGHSQAAPILLDGLSKLEYRGYDSAGLAVRDGENKTKVVWKHYQRKQITVMLWLETVVSVIPVGRLMGSRLRPTPIHILLMMEMWLGFITVSLRITRNWRISWIERAIRSIPPQTRKWQWSSSITIIRNMSILRLMPSTMLNKRGLSP